MIFTPCDVPCDVYDLGGQLNDATSLQMYNPYNLSLLIIESSHKRVRARIRAIGDRAKGRTSRTQVVRKSIPPRNGPNVSDGSHSPLRLFYGPPTNEVQG